MDVLDVKRKIRELVQLQIEIQSEFLKKWPNIKNWNYFFDVPANGELRTSDGDQWRFRKHGVGIEFVNQNEVLVDFVTQFKNHPEGIDAYRLSLYLESSGSNFENEQDGEDECVEILKRMSDMGFLQLIPGFENLYRIVPGR